MLHMSVLAAAIPYSFFRILRMLNGDLRDELDKNRQKVKESSAGAKLPGY
jgi:hypothetical protein